MYTLPTKNCDLVNVAVVLSRLVVGSMVAESEKSGRLEENTKSMERKKVAIGSSTPS